jgi:hypothetical protein
VGLQLKGGQAGDVNWILYSGYPSAGDFTIRESGVGNYLTIKKTTGYVGIGTDSPQRKFHVKGSIDIAKFEGGSGNIGIDNDGKRITGSNGLEFRGTGSGSSQVVLDSSGNVGIGTTSPGAKLEIYGLVSDNGPRIRLNEEVNRNWDIYALNGDFHVYDTVEDKDFFLIDGGTGNIGIGLTSPSHKLEVNSSGNIAYLSDTGAWTDASDLAYKRDIKDLNYSINDLLRIKPRSFKMKNSNKTEIGFIAQELEQVIPEVVYGKQGSKAIAYGHLTALLINSLKEEHRSRIILEDKIKFLESENLLIKESLCNLNKSFRFCK